MPFPVPTEPIYVVSLAQAGRIAAMNVAITALVSGPYRRRRLRYSTASNHSAGVTTG